MHLGSGGKLDGEKFVHFGVAGIRPLHCSMCVTSNPDSILLRPLNGARVRVNAHCIDGASMVSIGDGVLFARNILFVLCSGASVGKRIW